MVLAKSSQHDCESSLSGLYSVAQASAFGLLELIAAASLSCRASCFLWSEEINRGSIGDLFLALERASVLLGKGKSSNLLRGMPG